MFCRIMLERCLFNFDYRKGCKLVPISCKNALDKFCGKSQLLSRRQTHKRKTGFDILDSFGAAYIFVAEEIYGKALLSSDRVKCRRLLIQQCISLFK